MKKRRGKIKNGHPIYERLRAAEMRLALLEQKLLTLDRRPLLRRKDLAQKFGVCLRSVEKAMHDGRLPEPIYIFGPMWTPAQIEGLLWPLDKGV